MLGQIIAAAGASGFSWTPFRAEMLDDPTTPAWDSLGLAASDVTSVGRSVSMGLTFGSSANVGGLSACAQWTLPRPPARVTGTGLGVFAVRSSRADTATVGVGLALASATAGMAGPGSAYEAPSRLWGAVKSTNSGTTQSVASTGAAYSYAAYNADNGTSIGGWAGLYDAATAARGFGGAPVSAASGWTQMSLWAGAGVSVVSAGSYTPIASLDYAYIPYASATDATDDPAASGWTEITTADLVSTTAAQGRSTTPLTYSALTGIGVTVTGGGVIEDGLTKGTIWRIAQFPRGWRGDGTQAIVARIACERDGYPSDVIFALGFADSDGMPSGINGSVAAGLRGSGGSGQATAFASCFVINVASGVSATQALGSGASMVAYALHPLAAGIVDTSGAVPSGTEAMGAVATLRGSTGAYSQFANPGPGTYSGVMYPVLFAGTSTGWTGSRTLSARVHWKIIEIAERGEYGAP